MLLLALLLCAPEIPSGYINGRMLANGAVAYSKLSVPFSTPLPISSGGTGSATQNFVDLSTTQASIGGAKTWTGSNTFNNATFANNNNITLNSGGAFEFKRGFGFILDGFGADEIDWYLSGFNPNTSASSIRWNVAGATYAMKGLALSLDSTGSFSVAGTSAFTGATTVTNTSLTLSNGNLNLTNTTIIGVSSAGTWLSFQAGPYGDFYINGANGHALDFNTTNTGDNIIIGNGLAGGVAVGFYVSQATAITAHAGGGQGSCTAIGVDWARVDTIGTTGDSVCLPTCTAGRHVTVVNNAKNAAKALAVFPPSGGAIDAIATNTAYSLAGVASLPSKRVFECEDATNWISTP